MQFITYGTIQKLGTFVAKENTLFKILPIGGAFTSSVIKREEKYWKFATGSYSYLRVYYVVKWI